MSFGSGAWSGRRAAGVLLALAACAALAARAGAQSQLARADSLLERTAHRSPLLARPVTVNLTRASIEEALREVAAQASLRLSYSSDIIPADRRVTLARERVAAGDVIRDILHETMLDIVVSPSGYVVLVQTPRRGADDGLRAAPGDSLDRRSLAEQALARATVRAQLMDRVLVMGTPASGAPERSLPTAVSVVTANQLAQQHVATMGELLRTGIPGVVAWDLGVAGPFAQIGSVRGSSSFTANYLKTYVDGVELASPYLLFAIDPFSIERIEVIRGPQGSALYGSDAISGVVQVVTRKGTPSAKWRPQVDAALSAGRMESDYVDGANATQRHSAMLSSGGGTTSLGLGGTYQDIGAVIPGSASGYRGTFGGMRTFLGPVRLDATTRYADIRFSSPSNPLLRTQARELSAAIRPPMEAQRIENETYGLTADWQAREWLRQTLVVGLDRHSGSIPPQREPATVADALLGATQERVSKSSLRYALSAQLATREGAKLTATAGAERSYLERERLGTRSDVVGAGSGDGLASLYSDEVRNTGLFGQLRLEIADALFLSAGLRGERNSSFGEDYGTAYAPMVGAAFTRDVGAATLKLRAAYGKGIRPPAPSARRAIQTVGFRQLANPALEPEVQAGTEGGFELYVSDRASLSITGYSQNAEGLVQQVIPWDSTAARTIQYQNVGRIHNRGVEVEGSARAGAVRGNLTLSLTDSRVRALSQSYTGDLRVGDRVPEVPRASGLASLTFDAGRLRTTVGTSFIGSWIGYDWADFYSAEAGVTPQRGSLRGYWREYPSLTKPFASVSWTMGRSSEWYLRVDNLTNLQRFERDNLQITQGRTATLGLRVGR